MKAISKSVLGAFFVATLLGGAGTAVAAVGTVAPPAAVAHPTAVEYAVMV